MVDKVIELDENYRKTKVECDELRNKMNKISKQIGSLMTQGKKEEAEAVKKEVAEIKAKLPELEKLETELEEEKIKSCLLFRILLTTVFR